jgi:hypothetical protein
MQQRPAYVFWFEDSSLHFYGDGKAPRKILEAVVVRTSSIFCQHVRFGARKEI